jgi:hypothetical protein
VLRAEDEWRNSSEWVIAITPSGILYFLYDYAMLWYDMIFVVSIEIIIQRVVVVSNNPCNVIKKNILIITVLYNRSRK